jgi:hypothetical protein
VIGRRGLLALLAVTLVAAVAAWAVAGRDAEDAARADALMFPRLAEGLNDVRSLSVTVADERFTVRREGDGWVMDDKDGYPVRFEAVKGALMGLAGLRRVEAKTSNPELYSRLGVEDPSQPESTSTGVTATGEDGETLCDVIVGDPGTPHGTRYVRESGQGRAWQVRGQLSVDPRAVGWLDTTITELPAARIRSATVRHADGEEVRVAKQAADDAAWELADVPEGREPTSPSVARTVAGALERLELDDVAAASARPLPQPDPVETVFETFDGLRITVLSAQEEHEDETRTWATLSVEVLPEADDEVRAEGEALGERVAPWVYSLSSYRAASLRKRMEDLTRQAVPPDPEHEDPTAPGDVPAESETAAPEEAAAEEPAEGDGGGEGAASDEPPAPEADEPPDGEGARR